MKNSYFRFGVMLIVTFSILLWITSCCPKNCNAQEVKYNPYQMWVTDLDSVFTTAEEKELNQIITNYEEQTTCEIAILTTSDYEDFADIGDYAITLGEKWGVGKKDIDNGLMIIISKTNDENFVASGYGLEGYLPDAKLRQLSDTFLVSYFDKGEYFEGTKLFLNVCFEEIGDEYSQDENSEKREENENALNDIWLWFVGLPFWLRIVVGIVVGSLYVLWWILDWRSAYWFTIMIATFGRSSGGSMGGGKFGGGGSRS